MLAPTLECVPGHALSHPQKIADPRQVGEKKEVPL
jgi:hypothetical protein